MKILLTETYLNQISSNEFERNNCNDFVELEKKLVDRFRWLLNSFNLNFEKNFHIFLSAVLNRRMNPKKKLAVVVCCKSIWNIVEKITVTG